jgi:hypothetical protein
VFLGYSSSHLGYRCLDLESGRVYVSRHVRFHESVFPFKKSEQVTTPRFTPLHLPIFHPCIPLPVFSLFLPKSAEHTTHLCPLPHLPSLPPCPLIQLTLPHHPTQPYCHHVLVFPMIIVQEQVLNCRIQ